MIGKTCPEKTNSLNLKITPFEKEIIFQTSILGFKMLGGNLSHDGFWDYQVYHLRPFCRVWKFESGDPPTRNYRVLISLTILRLVHHPSETSPNPHKIQGVYLREYPGVFFLGSPLFLAGQSFRVRVRDGRTLEVLDVTFRADSSMGQVEVWWWGDGVMGWWGDGVMGWWGDGVMGWWMDLGKFHRNLSNLLGSHPRKRRWLAGKSRFSIGNTSSFMAEMTPASHVNFQGSGAQMVVKREG